MWSQRWSRLVPFRRGTSRRETVPRRTSVATASSIARNRRSATARSPSKSETTFDGRSQRKSCCARPSAREQLEPHLFLSAAVGVRPAVGDEREDLLEEAVDVQVLPRRCHLARRQGEEFVPHGGELRTELGRDHIEFRAPGVVFRHRRAPCWGGSSAVEGSIGPAPMAVAWVGAVGCRISARVFAGEAVECLAADR